jgi:hypothetical protein
MVRFFVFMSGDVNFSKLNAVSEDFVKCRLLLLVHRVTQGANLDIEIDQCARDLLPHKFSDNSEKGIIII